MIQLDMKTIVFGNVVTDIVCVLVIWMLWRQNRTHFSGTGFWVFDYAFQTTAMFLIILRGGIPDWMSFVLSNTLVIAGALLGYRGLERFLGKKSVQVHNYIFLTAFAGVHAYFTFLHPNLSVRNLNLSIGLFIVCFQCLWLLLYRVEPGLRSLTFGVGMVFGAYCLVSIIRILEFMSGSRMEKDFFQSGVFESLILVSYQILFILLTYSLALMYNKRLLAEVKTQEEKFFKAFHSSPYAVTLTRLSDGQIIEVNNGFLDITGFNPSDIVGKTTIDLHLWNKEEDRVTAVTELSKNGRVKGREFQFRKKSGEVIMGLFSAEIFRIDNRDFVLSSINDITERIQMEEALRESEEKYRLIAENAEDWVYWITPEGELRYISPSCELLTGYDPAEFISDKRLLLEIVHPEDRGNIERHLKNVQNVTGPDNLEYRIVTKTGETRWIAHSCKPVHNLKGQYTGRRGTNRNITARKRAEEEVRALNETLEERVRERTAQLEASMKELETFSYSVSHDLRSPLRAINGFSRILLEDYGARLDAEGRSLCAVIGDSARDMGRLIDALLTFSRTGRIALKPALVDMAALAQSAFLELTPPSDQERIDFQVGPLPSAWADPTLIRQVWVNLLENALKFSSKKERAVIEVGFRLNQEGGIEGKKSPLVADGNEDEGRPQSEIVYFVRDNGVGFDMEYKGKLFGVFERLHEVKDFGGTGVGLAIIERIIHRHGGRVWAEGVVEGGATFYFTIP